MIQKLQDFKMKISQEFEIWIKKQISSLSQGHPLASESELAQRKGVSRSTVARVLSQLAQEGLIHRIQGKGSFVGKEPLAPTTQPNLERNTATSAELVADYFQNRMAYGEMRVGDIMPQIKAVSIRLKVNPATVIEGYRILVQKGLISKIGKSYWIDNTHELLGPMTKKTLIAFSPDEISTSHIYNNTMMSSAFVRFEMELNRFGYVIHYHKLSEFDALSKKWLRSSKVRPDAILLSGMVKPYIKAFPQNIFDFFKKDRDLKIKILIAGEIEKPKLKDCYHFHQSHSTTLSFRKLAKFIRERQYKRIVIVRDPGITKFRFSMAGLLRLRPECKFLMPKAPVLFCIKTVQPEKKIQQLINSSAGIKPGNPKVLNVSKYETVSADTLLKEMQTFTDYEQLALLAKPGDVFVFDYMRNAKSGLDAFSQKGFSIPKQISLIALEEDRKLIHEGISSCVPNWDAAGYIMAHALIGDVTFHQSRRGFLPADGVIWDRLTT